MIKDEDVVITFGKNIDYLITNKIISVPTLCKIVDKDRNTIYKWSYGDRQVTFGDAIKIADYLKISIDDLISGDISNQLKDNYNIEKEEEKTMFSHNIKYLLNSKIVSVKTLCQITGVKESMISMWRNGKREGTLKDCIKISKFFGISIRDLMLEDISKTIKK